MTASKDRINTTIKGTIATPDGKQYLLVDTGKHRLIVPKKGAPQTIIGLLGALRRKGGAPGG